MKNQTYNTEAQAIKAAKKAGWAGDEFTTRKGPNDKWIFEVKVADGQTGDDTPPVEFVPDAALEEAVNDGGEAAEMEQRETSDLPDAPAENGPVTDDMPEQPDTESTADEGAPKEELANDDNLSEDELAVLRARKEELTAELGEINAKLATQQTVTQFRSAVGSPVQLCREVYIQDLLAAGKDPEKVVRKEVVGKLVALGVAANTAKTQYQILRTRALKGELLDEGDAEQEGGE